ncbi:MAG TPA: S-methyl-5'-thioadenosine phosphorylase [Firmicutes bacterium]|nr:S-methyl-5'-thioadenosine phosphorylase [Bacillota bacterium]
MDKVKIGVIGGSGISNIEGFAVEETVMPDTPFGKPSGEIKIGVMEGKRVAFLPRHGYGHVITPTDIPVQANIYAFKMLGVEMLISSSAVGSMKEEIAPGHFVVPTQLIDRTKARPSTFFGDGLVAHIPFDHPYCPKLREILISEGEKLGLKIHNGGTYVCIEGPQFSTKAESLVYQSWGVSIIGMTNIPEAKLAREAEICYATIALSTDYDVWREGEEVSVDKVLDTMAKNAKNANKLMQAVIKALPDESDCACRHVLQNSIQTSPDKINKNMVKKLDAIVGKYFK